MQRCAILCSLLLTGICLTVSAIAQEQDRSSLSARNASATTAAPNRTNSEDGSASSARRSDAEKVAIEAALRVEGEKRFRTNCGRCHMAPHKFPPRVMAAAIRHMRVRATLTEEDMRLILRYMTQ
ncbi:MAG TPA: cytochrome c [Candidatus Limnocylindrales bacterium]|nr:cytochrome c [Candidatus Limnocylindrales bacterium]